MTNETLPEDTFDPEKFLSFSGRFLFAIYFPIFIFGFIGT